MIKKILLAAPLVACLLNCYAQTKPNDTTKISQYVGLQVNPLIRQIINFNNNSAAIDDPFLLTYAITAAKSGWGLQLGIGYNYQDIKDESSPANHESKINDLSFRIGLCRKTMIGKRFEAGYGIDFVENYQSDKTTTVDVTDFGSQSSDSVTSLVSSTIKSYGFGPQASLGFYITRHLLISTEGTAYFLSATQKQNVFTTEVITNNGVVFSKTSANANAETKISSFKFTLPVAIFLTVKF